MEGDLTKALAYQIKKEIAERYFGYRKLIEDDKDALDAMVGRLERFFEQKVVRDLVRIYSLLHEEELIDRFLKLVAWANRPFYDEYVVESKTIRARLLEDLAKRGWTDHARFRNLMLDSYARLHKDASKYRVKRGEAVEEAAVINEEVRQFKEKFSLDEILSFINSLDRRDDLIKVLGENIPMGHTENLAARLDVTPIGDIDAIAPEVPDLPEPGRIKSELKSLADRAYPFHSE